MPWHFIFAPDVQDSLLLIKPLPNTFKEYLSSKGFILPQLKVIPECTPNSLLVPFGWNHQALNLRNYYHDQPAIPDLEVIRKVNSRSFSLLIEKSKDELMDQSGFLEFENLKRLENFLSENFQPHGWVVKANHGHAGIANRRIGNGELRIEDEKILSQYFLDHGKIVIEPWHRRLMDMAVNFNIELDGSLSQFCGHQLLNSQDGSFLGIKISPDRLPPLPSRNQLRQSANELTQILFHTGYFGPVSVDAYLWEEEAKPGLQQLRPYVDINARHSMALPIHGLAQRLPQKWLMWIWIKPRKLILPKNYFLLDQNLGAHAFDVKTQTGILATSPVFFDQADTAAASLNPKRIGFLFSADSEKELTEMQNYFANVMRKK